MNILQQLSETKLTKEEIEAIIDLSDHAVSIYKETLDNLDNVISLSEAADKSSVIKMIIESDEGFESKERTREEVIAYRQEIIDANKHVMDHLETAVEKLKELTKIFE
jgi:hypothetical protein